MRTLLIVLALLLGGCGGCAWVPPPAPPPVPPDPSPPAPVEEFVPRAVLEAVEIGTPIDALSELPRPHERVVLGEKVIWVYILEEARPDGGWVYWEIHFRKGVVVLSTAF